MATQDKLDISSILVKEEHVKLMIDIQSIEDDLEFKKGIFSDNIKALAEKLGVKTKIAKDIYTRFKNEQKSGDEIKLHELINSAVEQALTIKDSIQK